MNGAPTQTERTWGMLAHLLAFVGLVFPLPFVNAVPPLAIWLAKREESAFIADQAKESLNFNITVGIATVVCFVLMLILVGFLLLLALFVYWAVMTIIAAVKASDGVNYRYPVSLRLVR